MICRSTQAFGYGIHGNARGTDIDFSVENTFFDAWQYENTDGKMVDVSANDLVGSPIPTDT